MSRDQPDFRWLDRVEWTLLALSAFGLVALGVGYLMFPDDLMPSIAIAVGPEARVDLRATYGGSQIATGLILAWCLRRSEHQRFAVVLLFVLLSTVAASRGYAMWVEQVSGGPNRAGLLAEVFLALSFGGLILLRRRSSSS